MILQTRSRRKSYEVTKVSRIYPPGTWMSIQYSTSQEDKFQLSLLELTCVYVYLIWQFYYGSQTMFTNPKYNDDWWPQWSGQLGVECCCLKAMHLTEWDQIAEQTFKIKRRLVVVSVPAARDYSEWRGIKARQSWATLARRHFLCCTHTLKTCKQANACTGLEINEGWGHQNAL